MRKKITLSLIAAVAVIGGVALMSAYEAHVINVTAHVENALSVLPEHIDFGTVFPQEYVEDNFTISLSQSFMDEGRTDDVEYVINQKLKPTAAGIANFQGDIDAARRYCHTETPNPEFCYLSLCPFLSKLPQDEGETEVGELGYFDPQTNNCPPRTPVQVSGRLAKSDDDTSDTWTVDLKVPPIDGTIGQDWPASCADYTVPTDGADYGCDLWVEVTGISAPPDRFPLEGTAYIGYEDWTNGDLDYNDFGMDFSAQEYYETVSGTDYLTRVVMTFEAVIYDSGAEHYIHIKRPFNGNYSYTVTRGASIAGEVAAGNYNGSGDLDLVLFNTIKYSWPQINIGETVTVEVVLDNPNLNPRTALVAPRPDLDPFMDNYDPWENPYAGVVGTFGIAHLETIANTSNQGYTSTIVPVGTDVPFILVIPKTDWRAPHEDTTITGPYPDFVKFYNGPVGGWDFTYDDWYLNLVNNFVGYGGVAF